MSMFSYLVRDSFARCVEQPWTPLARGSVAGLVSALAVAALSSFGVAEKVILTRMERVGVNAVAVSSSLAAGQVPESGERYGWLESHGSALPLVRLYRVGKADCGGSVTVYGYSPSAVIALARVTSEPRVFLGNMPEGFAATVDVDGRMLTGVQVKRSGILARIPGDGSESVLLVPESEVADIIRSEGGIESWVFERNPDAALSLSSVVGAIHRVNDACDIHAGVVSATTLMEELDALRSKRVMVMSWMAALVAASVAAVFGALTLMEYRERRFVAGLLRGMGVRGAWLVMQVFGEGVFVALFAGLVSVSLLPLPSRWIAGCLGVSPSAIVGEVWSGHVLTPVAVALVLGAAVASLPVVVAMRRPIGLSLE